MMPNLPQNIDPELKGFGLSFFLTEHIGLEVSLSPQNQPLIISKLLTWISVQIFRNILTLIQQILFSYDSVEEN